MDVLFLSPAYPPEMQEYTRGLAEVGARVFGVGDSPSAGLPRRLRHSLDEYLQVPRILDQEDLVARVEARLRDWRPDRVETLWEPLILAAARLRERLGVSGMSAATALGFRDKQVMKERIAAAGLRVPRSARARGAEAARRAAGEIGYPLIVKPIAGAGSADTHRVDDAAGLDSVLAATAHVPELSVEEFVEGEEFTYDTISIDGRPVWENVAQYLPRPLEARSRQELSPIIITVREMGSERLRPGIELGHGVLAALGMGTGFTHMEWFLTSRGEAVFGEIGCRPGGAHLVDQMNYTADIDLFREWARAVCWRRFAADSTRKYNCAIVFKRAVGEGKITRIEGLEEFLARHGQWVCTEQLLRPGQPRRNWRQTLVSDGFLILRHPDWTTARALAEECGAAIRMFAEPE